MSTASLLAMGTTATVCFHAGHVLSAHVSGVVTYASMAQTAAWLAQIAAGRNGVSGVLVSFSESMFVLNCAQMAGLLPSKGGALRLPCAFVVKPSDVELFQCHAWNAAQGGIVRGVFTERAAALRWLETLSAVQTRAVRRGSASGLEAPARKPARALSRLQSRQEAGPGEPLHLTGA